MFSTDLDLWHSELPLQRAEIPAGLAHCFYCLFQFETFQWNFQRYIAKVTFQIKMHQAGQESSRVFSGERERKCPHREWRKHKAGSALSFMEVLLWTSVGGGFGPLFKHLLRDSGSGKLSLSVVLPWVCWEQKCPGAQPHIVWLLCSWGPQGKLPAQFTHCKHLENVIDELAEVWDVGRIISSLVADCWDATVSPVVIPLGWVGLMAVVFHHRVLLHPQKYLVVKLLNYWMSFCSVTYQTLNALLWTWELKSISASPAPPRAVTLTVACVVHSGAKQGLNSAPVTSSGSWGCIPPSSGCSVESLSSPKSLSLHPLPAGTAGTAVLFLCVSSTFQLSADKMLPLLLMSLNFSLWVDVWPVWPPLRCR